MHNTSLCFQKSQGVIKSYWPELTQNCTVQRITKVCTMQLKSRKTEKQNKNKIMMKK